MEGSAITRITEPKTVQEAVVDTLRDAIVHGRLMPGQPIDQTEVAEWLNVSRVPVREALRTLEAEGLVTYYPHRKAFVSTLSDEEAREICELRLTLELMALRYAVEHITPALCEELGRILADMERQETDPVAWAGLNHQFHATLHRASGRNRLCHIISVLRNAIRAYVVADMSDPERCRKADREHRELLEMCCRGDTNGAQQVLREHLLDSAKRVAFQVSEVNAELAIE
jgi:DNA-binding GntR family transcriptional regulator